MVQFLLRKFLSVIPIFFGITIIAFGLIRMVPGDPVLIMIGERGSSPEVYAQMKKNLGLDRPLLVQYWQFVTKAAQGDLGESIVSKRKVTDEFRELFPATLELGFVALFFATLIGIPLGILAAVKRNSFLDYFVMGSSLVGYSMPIFWWGLLLILFFSVNLGLTPVSGRISVMWDIPPVTGFMLFDTWLSPEAGWAAFKDAAKHIILPSIALGTIPLAVIARMTRSSMLEVIGEDYIRTAKAKGLSSFRIVYVHALRNAMIPVLTIIGLMMGTIVTGAILTETIFSWPGIGRWFVRSVTSRDYPVIQGGILVIAVIIVFINGFVDVMYAVVNPRMRDKKS